MDHLKIGIVTQVRVTSTRLPAKVLLSVRGRTYLEHHLDRLSGTGLPVIVATTTSFNDDIVMEVAGQSGIPVFRGSEDDVLSRFAGAAREHELDGIVRATSDCPLIDPEVVATGVDRWRAENDLDLYLSNCLERPYPRGMDYEIFSAAAEGSDIVVREHTDATPHLCLQGPRSREILQRLTDANLSNEVFPYYTFREDVEIAGIPVFMTRLGYTAELGYELWVDRARAFDLWDALIAAGNPQGMKVIGMVALDLFRIEGGFIIGGIEYDPTVSPYECGLGWSVDLDKGEFQGREALARDKEATQLRLTSIVLASGGDEASGAPLWVGDEEVGLVTQAVVSPYLGGRTLGLAKIRKDLNQPGQSVVAQVGEEQVAGELVTHPAYDKERRRAKES